MSFHVKRTSTAKNETLAQYGGLRTTRWVTPGQGKSVLEIQTVQYPVELRKIPEDKNYLPPPYHWHWYQDEYFYVKSGRYIFTLEGKVSLISSSDPQPVRIPAKAHHTFRPDDSCEVPCTVEISADASPEAHAADAETSGISAKFFRNIYSYLDDCQAQDVAPSLPQLLLFLDSAEVSLAFPWGPAWFMRAVSYSMGVVVGRWFGGFVLGYRASYPEYWDEELESRKRR